MKVLLYLILPLLAGWCIGGMTGSQDTEASHELSFVEPSDPLPAITGGKKSSDILKAVDAASSMSSHKRKWALGLIFEEQVQSNPQEALALAHRSGSNDAVLAVLEIWAGIDAPAAFNAFFESETDFVETLSAMALAARCKDPKVARDCLLVMEMTGERIPSDVFDKVRRPDCEAEKIDENVDAFIESIRFAENEQEAESLIELLLRNRADQAMRYFNSLPEAHPHRLLIMNKFESENDLIQARQLLSQDDLFALFLEMPPSQEGRLSALGMELGERFATSDPRLGLSLAESMERTDLGLELRDWILQGWGGYDQEGVTGYLESIPASRDHWKALQNTVNGRAVIWDFEASEKVKGLAIDWLDALDDEAFAAERSDVMVRKIPEYLISRCQRLEDAGLAVRMLNSAARSKHDGIARFVSSIPEGSLRDRVVHSLVSEPEIEHAGWRRGWQLDMEGFTPLVAAVSNPELRESCFRAMATTYARRHESPVRELKTVEEVFGEIALDERLRGDLQEILDGGPLPE